MRLHLPLKLQWVLAQQTLPKPSLALSLLRLVSAAGLLLLRASTWKSALASLGLLPGLEKPVLEPELLLERLGLVPGQWARQAVCQPGLSHSFLKTPG